MCIQSENSLVEAWLLIEWGLSSCDMWTRASAQYKRHAFHAVTSIDMQWQFLKAEPTALNRYLSNMGMCSLVAGLVNPVNKCNSYSTHAIKWSFTIYGTVGLGCKLFRCGMPSPEHRPSSDGKWHWNAGLALAWWDACPRTSSIISTQLFDSSVLQVAAWILRTQAQEWQMNDIKYGLINTWHIIQREISEVAVCPL